MALGIDDTDYYSKNPNNDWTFNTYTAVDGPPFKVESADPDTCEHEWWEDTLTTYTTHPAQYRQVCRLCGSTHYRYQAPRKLLPRWKRVT